MPNLIHRYFRDPVRVRRNASHSGLRAFVYLPTAGMRHPPFTSEQTRQRSTLRKFETHPPKTVRPDIFVRPAARSTVTETSIIFYYQLGKLNRWPIWSVSNDCGITSYGAGTVAQAANSTSVTCKLTTGMRIAVCRIICTPASLITGQRRFRPDLRFNQGCDSIYKRRLIRRSK